jgi:isocitrate dehydrogenase kinase/phosphatase
MPGRTDTLSIEASSNSMASVILAAFNSYIEEFERITARAADRFLHADWEGGRADIGERLALYRNRVDDTVRAVAEGLGDRFDDRATWVLVRGEYEDLIRGTDHPRVSQTWFNSITRRVFDTVGIDPEIDFVGPSGQLPESEVDLVTSSGFDVREVVTAAVRSVGLRGEWKDLSGDIALVAQRLKERGFDEGHPESELVIEMIPWAFYRGRACYLVGRMTRSGDHAPLILSIRNPDGRMVIDAVLTQENLVSVLFSFTRSHFHVLAPQPGALVRFLRSIMPRKRVAELFISIGFHKHGKTELYRDLLDHLGETDQRFEIAPGQRGLVMVVFAMPGYDVVFKIIKDTFPPPKRTTRGQIREKYELVFEHDRAGRLVEAHEFEHLSLSRHRFSPELLEVLADECARSVQIVGDRIVLEHAYLERRVIPLDLYLREREDEEAAAAILDYGNAIRDLMASDIFPGDMLLKNFGVTRHGRVVFYDYDELTRLRECTFRPIPEPPTIDDAMADTPWFPVAEGDVFPEEFSRFMGLPASVRPIFHAAHADLFDHVTWAECQHRILGGEVIEIYPYPDTEKLR